MRTDIRFKIVNGRDYLGGLDVNDRIILKRFLGKQGVRLRIGFNWLTIGSTDRMLKLQVS
jgi:hypothetical protein